MAKRILVYDYLKVILTLLVVFHHASFAYLESFDMEETDLYGVISTTQYASPIIDEVRWIGFDVIAALNDTFFMSAFFLVSGIFIAMSVKKHAKKKLVEKKLKRLGIPFVFGMFVLAPVTYYFAHVQFLSSLSFFEFYSFFVSKGFFAMGQLWYIWLLLLFSLLFILLYGEHFKALVKKMYFLDNLMKTFVFLVLASTLAYLPMDYFFGSVAAVGFGPFQLQPSRVLHYLLFFFIGAALSMRGLQRSSLRESELLRNNCHFFMIVGIISFSFWFSLAATSLTFAFIGFSYSIRRSWIMDSLSRNAYGIYLFHFLIGTVMQFFLLPIWMPAILKGIIVFIGSLGMSWFLSHQLISNTKVGQIL